MPRILCLDDDRTSLAILCAILRECGHEPLPLLHDGQIVEQIRKYGAHAAVVDLLMPGCDGSQVIANIRSELGPEFPVIVSSTTNLHLRDGGDARTFYAPKPVEREKIASILRRLDLCRPEPTGDSPAGRTECAGAERPGG